MLKQKTSNPKTGHWFCLNLGRNNLGMTLVEVLAASAIMGVGLLGLGMSINAVGKARAKTAVVNAAISLQSRIQDAITNPASYPDNAAFRTAIASGDATVVTGLSNVQISDTNPPMNIPRNTFLYFNRDLAPCGGFGDPDCVLRMEVDFRNGIPVRGAFQIIINPTSNVIMAPFGSMKGPTNPFPASDYKLALPTLSSKHEFMQGCDPTTDIGIMGVHRDTGQVTGCIGKPDPTAVCPDGRLGRGFVLGPGNRLVLDCSVGQGYVPRRPTCGNLYALQTISDPRNFDPAFNTNSNITCRWIAQEQEFRPRPPNAQTINQRLCPRPSSYGGPAYRHSHTCTLGLNAPVTGVGCSTAGCTATRTNFGPPPPPTPSFTVTDDAVNCTVPTNTITVSDAGLFACGDGSERDSIYSGYVILSPATNVDCRLIPAPTTNGVWQP